MSDRTFDRKLPCGCLLSSDAGGCCIPCCYPGYGATDEEIAACESAWEQWKKSEDYKKYWKEVQEKNNC